MPSKKPKIIVRVSDELRAKVEEYASMRNISMSDAVSLAIFEMFKREGA
jgi:predicted transcriptional regulator